MRYTTLLAAGFLVVPAGAAAQSHQLVGVWTVTHPSGMRVENGVRTPISGTATLTIETKGDSLVANFVPDSVDGHARPPSRFAAKTVEGAVTFVQISEAILDFGGGEEKRTATARWTLAVKDGMIEGTVDRTIEGLAIPMGGPQPVSGVRKAAP